MREQTLCASFVASLMMLASWGAAGDCDPSTLAQLQPSFEGEDPPSIAEQLELAEQLVSECPSSAEAQLAHGFVLESMDKLAAAASAYRNAAALAPDSAVPWARLAQVARLQGEVDSWELYIDSARALEQSENDRLEIERASKEAAEEEQSGSYSFKNAGEIGDGLRVGSKSIRPKSVSNDTSGDYFVGSKGFGVNLGILFEVGTTALKPEGSRQLDQLGQALRRASSSERYLIEGHSSSEGDPAFNDQLSQDRAQAIADALMRDFGIQSGQVEFVGRGTRFPILDSGVEDRGKSRRVTVLRLYDE